MNLIGFSHHYTKLHGQEYGTLIAVDRIKVSPSTVPAIAIAYDTEYYDTLIHGRANFAPFKYGVGDICLRLTFIGNHGIPFTTYRDIPDSKTYVPFGREPVAFRFSLPYVELVTLDFAFKFKGEPPSELCKQADGVKIYN